MIRGSAARSSAVGLADRADELALALSHGEQRQLEIAMCLATEPQLLLLDEPLAGMGAEESLKMVELIDQAGREPRGPAGRARHGCGVSIGQGADGDGQRQGAGFRHARRDPRQPRSAGSLSRRPSRTCRNDRRRSSKPAGCTAYYGASHILQGIDFDGPGRRGDRLDGSKRHGQDHLAPHHARPSAGAPRRSEDQR